MSLCVPILCGVPVKLRPEGDKRWVLCPNCHEITAFTALRARWLEFFFIPVIPLSWEHIWFCHTCEWTDTITKEEWRAQLREAAESRAKIAAALGVNGEHTDVVQPFSPWPPQEPLTEDGGGHGNDAALPTSALATSSAAGALPIWQRRLSVSTARRRSIESSARRPPRTRAMLLHLPSASSYHYWSSELGSGSTRDRLEWPRNIEV